jgi:hypothetical protein
MICISGELIGAFGENTAICRQHAAGCSAKIFL